LGGSSAQEAGVGNLDKDTSVTRTGDHTFVGELSPDWAVWGPNGGYLAAIALRAAGAFTEIRRPASIHCVFARIGSFGPVDIAITSLVRSRQAESLQVELTQRNRLVARAAVWAVNSHPTAPRRSWGDPPSVPAPDELRPIDELVAEEGGPVLPIWRTCCEVRVAGWGGPDRPAGQPHLFGWLRFREPVNFGDDPWLSAGRAVFATDAIVFPAIGQGFAAREMTFIAPSLDLYASFHTETCGSEWVLLEGDGLAAASGLLGGNARVWAPDGMLVASGSQQMLVRQAMVVPR
jgi:acyl-CoA thioesterase